MSTESYVIRGGSEGRARLRILSEVMGEPTAALLDDAGIRLGSVCVDLGCGGGDVAFELARRVGPAGRVIGIDRDEKKLAIARSDASEQGIENIEFQTGEVMAWEPDEIFDVAYARFLFSHIADPKRLLRTVRRAVRPGGAIIIEDVDFRGHFSEPRSDAFDRYVELYTESVRRRGGNAAIGPSLPGLLRDAGFTDVRVRVSHPVALVHGIKTLTCLTMESISEAVLSDGLISPELFQRTVDELRVMAEDPHVLGGGPRVFQVWGTAQLPD